MAIVDNSQDKNKMQTRQIQFRQQTANENERTIEVVLSTEKAVTVYDWQSRNYVDEILLTSGAEFPEQLPLLDSHNREKIEDVIGSLREIKINGEEIIARAYFASTDTAKKAFVLAKENHLTDLSIGYVIRDSQLVTPGNSLNLNGKQFKADKQPLKIATKYRIFEGSMVPIGANDEAKTRDYALSGGKEKMVDEIKVPGKPAIIDLEAQTRQAIETERKRIASIMQVCATHEVDSKNFIERGSTLQDVHEAILAQIATRRTQGVQAPQHVDVIKDSTERAREYVENSIALRMHLEKPHEKVEANHLGLTDLARELLRSKVTGIDRMSKREIAKLCFRGEFSHTPSDFPKILENAINKRLGKSFETAPSTYQIWCNIVEVPDFKDVAVNRLSEGADLELIPPGGEYPEETYSEEQETYALDKYGKVFTITWEALVNDDLRAFDRIAAKQGYRAKYKVNKLVYSVLTTNANMSDSVPLFHATHNNKPTGAVLSLDSLAVARAEMRGQTGLDADDPTVLNLVAKYLIVPAALETTALQLYHSEVVPGATYGHSLNVLRNSYIPVIEPQLDVTSTVAWYLATDPNLLDTIEVAFLEGYREPYLEEEEGFMVDGRKYKVMMPCAAKAIDWRGLYYNDGTP